MACPHKCVFCDQKEISGTKRIPSESEIHTIIEDHLTTIPEGSDIEIAFFGGTFTGLPVKKQERYLQSVSPYLKNGRIKSIRVSTRPDNISEEILSMLEYYNVGTIELGVQSMDHEVLRLSKRGHSSEDVIMSSRLIKERGFHLGLQMMIGLPGDTIEKSMMTAKKIAELGADCTRIYPAIVVRGTELENDYNRGVYSPLTIEEAVSWCADILPIFEKSGVDVIRIGLHPSEDLLSGDALVAGPFHPSFRELVLTEIWCRIFEKDLSDSSYNEIAIWVSPEQFNYATGYNGRNKKNLTKFFDRVVFRKDNSLKGRAYRADLCR